MKEAAITAAKYFAPDDTHVWTQELQHFLLPERTGSIVVEIRVTVVRNGRAAMKVCRVGLLVLGDAVKPRRWVELPPRVRSLCSSLIGPAT
jgi:hypothetical protein